METIINTIPGYRVYEYLLVLSPHEELWNRIMKVKENFAEAYKSDHARWGKPHITLANFLQYEMKEERIINHLKRIAMGYPPFKVELKDFGSFPSHTIYINVTSKLPIQNLIKEIRPDGNRLMKLNDDNKPHFITEPHLTIARKLKPWQYEKGWLEQFIQGVLASPRITASHYRDYHNAEKSRGIIYLPTASYIEMNEWTLPADLANRYA